MVVVSTRMAAASAGEAVVGSAESTTRSARDPGRDRTELVLGLDRAQDPPVV